MFEIIKTVKELREKISSFRNEKHSIGFVPTMGAIHEGHISLVKLALKENSKIVTSVFVNPLQFNSPEDLAKYPRTLETDAKKLSEGGANILFAPDITEMYEDGFQTTILPGPLAEPLEGLYRPGHFSGMATVVAKLLLQVLPDRAYFGEKDFQQLAIIKAMTRDLSFPVQIIAAPIIREKDGLALSSRNMRLSETDRQRAVHLPKILFQAAHELHNFFSTHPKPDYLPHSATVVSVVSDESATSVEQVDAQRKIYINQILQNAKAKLTEKGFLVDYLEIADPETLQPPTKNFMSSRLLVAASLNGIRLIDNVQINSVPEI